MTWRCSGSASLDLWLASTAVDTDLQVTLSEVRPKDATGTGDAFGEVYVQQGWLRASHRKLDATLSEHYRPYHPHDEIEPLEAGEVYELDIEILPTSLVMPAGSRIALSVLGRDYEYPGPSGGFLSNFKNELRGCGPFLHDDPRDRPAEIFDNTVTLHAGGRYESWIQLPVIPPA